MKKILITILMLLISFSIFSNELDSYRDKGLIGELPNGYIAPVKTGADDKLMTYVRKINNIRRKKYSEIVDNSKDKSLKLAVVEIRAGAMLQTKVKKNHYYKKDNKWIKKNK